MTRLPFRAASDEAARQDDGVCVVPGKERASARPMPALFYFGPGSKGGNPPPIPLSCKDSDEPVQTGYFAELTVE